MQLLHGVVAVLTCSICLQLTIPPISSFLEMMAKKAAKSKQNDKHKTTGRKRRFADKNANDEWLMQDGLMLELMEALSKDMHRRESRHRINSADQAR